jgi:hypothetical protein
MNWKISVRRLQSLFAIAILLATTLGAVGPASAHAATPAQIVAVFRGAQILQETVRNGSTNTASVLQRTYVGSQWILYSNGAFVFVSGPAAAETRTGSFEVTGGRVQFSATGGSSAGASSISTTMTGVIGVAQSGTILAIVHDEAYNTLAGVVASSPFGASGQRQADLAVSLVRVR